MKTFLPVLLVVFVCCVLVLSAAIDLRAWVVDAVSSPHVSKGSTLVVTKTADTADGVCDADCSLREAVTAAASGDTVIFSTLFDTPQTITLTLGQITIDKNLTITGTGQNLTTISGNLAGRIFLINANLNVTMSGMKLRDGKVGANAQDVNGGAIRVLFGSGNLNLSNMEFTNNLAFNEQQNSGLGSAVFCAGCTMTLDNLNVHHNQRRAIYGFDDMATVNIRDSNLSDNGIGVTAYTLNMQNTTVARNTSAGISSQHLTLINSRIIDNDGRGVTGGNFTSTMTVENSIISGNSDSGLSSGGVAIIRRTLIKNNTTLAGGWGGGIINSGIMYTIDSSITGNLASQGGGINTGSTSHLFVTNSTISGNSAFGSSANSEGGGIYNADDLDSQVTLINSTIVNNQSSGKGGGVRQGTSGSVTVRNTIVAQNTSLSTNEEDVSGHFISNGVNLIGNTTGSSGWISTDLLNQNPLISSLGSNGSNTLTHALLPGSPAINAGDNSIAVDPQTMLHLTHDQRGFSRISGEKNLTVDIGAYEAFYSSTPVTVSGRITNYTGRGLDRTRIKLDDGNGNIIYTQTNPFGYYRFRNLIPGITYTITITHKSYLFASPQFFTADQNRSDLNFITGF